MIVIKLIIIIFLLQINIMLRIEKIWQIETKFMRFRCKKMVVMIEWQCEFKMMEIRKNTMEDRKKLNKIKRNNAKLYPIYKMFSWDLLFFYSVEFLFYTITKKVTASEILIINGFYLLFRILMQIPAVTITDSIGKRKSIILGNIMLIFYADFDICTRSNQYNYCRFNICFRIWYENNSRI